MQRSSRLFAVLFFFGSATLGACHHGSEARGSEHGNDDLPAPFPLTWPSGESSPTLSARGRDAVASPRFHVGLFVDRRREPSRIGTDDESKGAFLTTSNVAEATTAKFKQLINDAGFKLGDDGTVGIRGEVLTFEVNEGQTFRAEVRLLLQVSKPGAPQPFEHTYVGQASNWGRTHSVEQMREALSDAMLNAVNKFVSDDAFLTFLDGKANFGTP